MHGLKSLLLRLASAVYDLLVLVALWILAAAFWIFVAVQLDMYRPGEPLVPWNIAFDAWIFGVSYLYLAGLWQKTGQTLGMRPWRLRVVTHDGGNISWGQGLTRMLAAILSWLLGGAGFLWILFDREQLALHDRLSGTRVVRVTGMDDA